MSTHPDPEPAAPTVSIRPISEPAAPLFYLGIDAHCQTRRVFPVQGSSVTFDLKAHAEAARALRVANGEAAAFAESLGSLLGPDAADGFRQARERQAKLAANGSTADASVLFQGHDFPLFKFRAVASWHEARQFLEGDDA